MKKLIMRIAVTGLFALWSVPTMAGVISINVPNYSFEKPVTNTFTMEIDTWEDPGSTGVFKNSGQFGNVITNAVGNQMAFMNCNSSGVGPNKNNIYIDLPDVLTRGIYTLTVGVAARRDSTPANPANTKMELKLFTRVPTLTVLASQEVVYSNLSNTSLTYYSAVLDGDSIPAASIGSTFGIWLDSTVGTSGDWTLDNVTLTMIPMNASNPAPANGQTNVGTASGNGSQVLVQLSWETGRNASDQVNPNVTAHYLYLRAGEPNFVDVSPVTIPAGMPPSEIASYTALLNMDTTYYWRVDESIDGSAASDPNSILGPIWSFQTLKSIPIINTQPQDQHVSPGETAVFTVEASSVSPVIYSWFKSKDNANNTIDDDIWVGEDSSTLTIVNVSLADEGYYYCSVINDSGIPATSTAAFLEIKRLVAWYAFENDITDSAGDNDGTMIKADPNLPFPYAAGKIGMSIVLNGIDEAVMIPRSIQDSFTICLWVKTADLGGEGEGWWVGKGLVDGEMPGLVSDFGTSLYGSKFAFGVGPNTTITSVASINDAQWHYCVATRDHVTGQMKLYVDGTLEKTAAGPLGRRSSTDSLRIGKIRWGLNYLNGQIDDVKLYNYPLSELEIAQSYHTVTGESVCLTAEKPSLDLNNDCKVDLGDFSLLVEQWLDCGLMPDCIQ